MVAHQLYKGIKMANPTNLPGDLIVPGDVRITGSITPGLSKDNVLAQADLQAFNVPWTIWRTFDAMGTNLPSAAANDDLGLVGGTHGTNHIVLDANDVGGLTNIRYARGIIALPWEYVAGQTVQLRFYAGCQTSAPDTTCTLDIQAYPTDGDNTVGADLASAAVANNMQSTSFANVDFTITATSLSPGDELDVLIGISYADTGDADVMIPTIGKIQLLCDVR
jgi:hypothetical protein